MQLANFFAAGCSYYPVEPSTDENVIHDWGLGWNYAEAAKNDSFITRYGQTYLTIG